MTIAKAATRLWALLAAALALVLIGGSVAALTQTSFGAVEVRETSFMGSNGQIISGELYVPTTTSAENPAPGILAVHGYINSHEMQLASAIELSRRGYVVLAIDQTGHGDSDAPAFSGGFGGPAALAYLRSLDIVDVDNIGMTGHSLGGSTIMAAASAFPDGYKSMVLLDSATGFFGAPGTPDFPRNTLVVFAEWEEFSGSMWESPNSFDLVNSAKLKEFFGTTEAVKVGELYGSIEDGTARKLVRPLTNHPGATHDLYATQDIIDWFGQTLDGGREVSGQTWFLKEIGTLLAFVGGILSIFAVGGLLLRTRYFGAIQQAVPAPKGARWGLPWIIGALLTAGIPAVTFIWFNTWGAQWIPVNGVLSQSFATGIAVWALLNGIIGLIILAVTRAITKRNGDPLTKADLGVYTDGRLKWSVVGKSALLAVLSVGAAYLLLLLSEWLFSSDFRFYVLQLQPLSAEKFATYLAYLVPFTLFFLMLALAMHSGQRWTGRRISRRAEMVANAIVLPLGIVVLMVICYVPLLTAGQLAFPAESLLTIVAYPFIPMLAIVGLLSTYFFHKTGTIYAGAFAAALLVTWNIVGGTATQGVVEEWGGWPFIVRTIIPLVIGAVLVVVAFRLRKRGGVNDDAANLESAKVE